MARTASKAPTAIKTRTASKAAPKKETVKETVEEFNEEADVCEALLETTDEMFLDDVAEDDELAEIEASDEVEETAEAEDVAAPETEKRYAVGTGTVNRKELDATRLYLREIEYSPLLTAEEEVYYSRLSRKGVESAR
ncbi:MAG: polymerase nonessential primary-like sigma factor, partial [Pseudomonadota bacterium]|nr:polymerase nonessential primary-like sigma factor [Pseudomonadota bacterium]